MRKFLLAVLILAATGSGCFSKYKKGIVTEGADSFSGAAEIKWNGWLDQTTAKGLGVQMVRSMAGMGVEVTNIDTVLSVNGTGKSSAVLTAKFGLAGTEGTKFANESSIPWMLKGCKEIEIKTGGEVTKVPAAWDGRVVMGDPSETITAEVPAEALAGLSENGTLALRACSVIAASTEKQVESLKTWATKAALRPAPKPAPTPQSTSTPASAPANP